MTVNDLSKELLDKIRMSFDTNRDVMLLRTAQQNAAREGNFQKALYVAQQIDELWTICLDNYLRKMEQEAGAFTMDAASIPEEDRERLVGYTLVLYMCCDIIESAVMDFDDLLKKTRKDASMKMFDDLKQVLGLASEKLSNLQDTGDYMKDMSWAESCDNMYQMFQNKVGALMRKRKTDPNWGKKYNELNNR
jgi:hypothetical protein